MTKHQIANLHQPLILLAKFNSIFFRGGIDQSIGNGVEIFFPYTSNSLPDTNLVASKQLVRN